MVPFLRVSAEIIAHKTKALQEDARRMQNVFAANDDTGYHAKYFDKEEQAAANE